MPLQGDKNRKIVEPIAAFFFEGDVTFGFDAVLKPAEEIRRLYTDAGITENEVVVTYCQTGVQAAHSYFTLKYLGYTPRMYDGSFVEWSAQENTPVETGPTME